MREPQINNALSVGMNETVAVGPLPNDAPSLRTSAQVAVFEREMTRLIEAGLRPPQPTEHFRALYVLGLPACDEDSSRTLDRLTTVSRSLLLVRGRVCYRIALTLLGYHLSARDRTRWDAAWREIKGGIRLARRGGGRKREHPHDS